jgi:hypothetical protein
VCGARGFPEKRKEIYNMLKLYANLGAMTTIQFFDPPDSGGKSAYFLCKFIGGAK